MIYFWSAYIFYHLDGTTDVTRFHFMSWIDLNKSTSQRSLVANYLARAVSQDFESGHPKCDMESAQMNNLLSNRQK